MPIRVFVDYIDENQYNSIVDYYNMNLPFDHPKLEILDRCEGGFQIERLYKTGHANRDIKQLRWKKKYLMPFSIYECFSKYEELQLFIAMKVVLGDNVVFEE